MAARGAIAAAARAAPAGSRCPGPRRGPHPATFSGMAEYDIGLKIKVSVESWSSTEAHPATQHGQPPFSAANEIGKLKALLDEGALTAEEFVAMKKQLLAG